MNSRKSYIKPELVKHGTINELTNQVKTAMQPGDGWVFRMESGEDVPIGDIS